MTYFETCETVADIKARYRELIFSVHPDRHDASEFDRWNAEAQKLNAAYQDALKGQHNTVYRGTDNRDHTYYYNEDREEELAQKIQDLIAANLSAHISIEIIGTWIWVLGTRREDAEDRAKLKELGMRWHSKRQKWYWRQSSYRREYSGMDFDKMRHMYSSRTVNRDEEEEREKVAIAA